MINLYERDGQHTYDSSPVIDADGTLLGVTRMIHITDYPCFHEQGYYTPGDKGAPVFKTKAGKIGVSICYDRHFPEYMRALAVNGADLVIVPQAGAVDEWPEGLYEAEMRVAAFQNGYFTALCNRVGKEDCLDFAGESFVCGPDGEVIARGAKSGDEIVYADIDFAKLAQLKRATVVPETPPAGAVRGLDRNSVHEDTEVTKPNPNELRASVTSWSPWLARIVTARTDRTPTAASRALSTVPADSRAS